MLKILSLLNWLTAALYVAVLLFVWVRGGEMLPFDAFALVAMVLLLMALPSAYLGFAIEEGRGRLLQTIFAVISLCNFPLGTAYGAFALWVCWSAEAAVFERGGVDVPAPTRKRRQQPVAEVEDVDDEATTPAARTPQARAQRMKKQGLSAGDIQEALHAEGLSAQEIEEAMTSIGLRFSKIKQKHLEEFS